MTARFASGSGPPPAHVREIRSHDAGATLVVRDASGDVVESCRDDAALRARIASLIAARVPFAIGGMAPGPADVVAALAGETAWLELAWRRPGEWVVREMIAGATEWREVPLGELLAVGSDA